MKRKEKKRKEINKKIRNLIKAGKFSGVCGGVKISDTFFTNRMK